METDFSSVMAQQTDKQLVEIVTIKQNEYQPEALLAAINELNKRNITVNKFYTPSQFDELANAPLQQKQTESLTWQHKTLIVVAPVSIMVAVLYINEIFFHLAYAGGLGFCLTAAIAWLIHKNLKTNYQLTKAHQFKNWVIYTVYIYAGILALFTLYVLLFGLN